MKVNLNFAPSRVAMLCQAVHESLIVFLRRIKIRVAQGLAFVIPPGADCQWIFAAPFCQATLLLEEINRNCGRLAAIHGLKVVGHANH